MPDTDKKILSVNDTLHALRVGRIESAARIIKSVDSQGDLAKATGYTDTYISLLGNKKVKPSEQAYARILFHTNSNVTKELIRAALIVRFGDKITSQDASSKVDYVIDKMLNELSENL